jgi:hypothetical protein
MLLRNKYDLKKLEDFTVSEGHGYPLILYNESKHNILALLGKTNKFHDVETYYNQFYEANFTRPVCPPRPQ